MTLIRRGERAYYYESRRVDGRVVNRYLACGEVALSLAALDEHDARAAKRIRARERREQALHREKIRALKRAARERIERIESDVRALKAYCDDVDAIVRGRLEAAGFHRHDRGRWRRRRGISMGRDHATSDLTSTEDQEFLRRAASGDRSTLPAIRKILDDAEAAGIGPAVIAAFRGDPARELESRLIEVWAGENLPAAEALRRRMDQLRNELAGPAPTAIERLLAERASICWLAVNCLEAESVKPGTRPAVRIEKQVGIAQGRFLAALKALAAVRKLGLPEGPRDAGKST